MAHSALNYDPKGRYDFKVEDVEYRHDSDQSWLAMVYQPQGHGPFPALLDIFIGLIPVHLIEVDCLDTEALEALVTFFADALGLEPWNPFAATVPSQPAFGCYNRLARGLLKGFAENLLASAVTVNRRSIYPVNAFIKSGKNGLD